MSSLRLRLKSKRSSVTKLCNRVCESLESVSISSVCVRTSLNECLKLEESLEILHVARENEMQVEAEAAGVGENTEDAMLEEFEKMDEYREKLSHVIAICRARLHEVEENVSSQGESHAQNAHIRLPKITLPTFSGDILEWTSFIECFDAAIDEADISQTEKFAYLRGQLRDDALDCVSGMSLTAANYKIAKDELRKRYGDDRLIIREHVKKLLNIDQVKSLDLSSLKRFRDKVQIHIRCLETYDVTSDKYGIL